MKARVRFEKLGKVRFLSHRDIARIWERSLRRAGVAVTYSEGFSPRPRLHFGLALSTGHESVAEYLDIDLADGADVAPEDLPDRVAPSLPPGMRATAAVAIDVGTGSLQQSVTSCSWQLEVVGAEPEQVAAAAARALAATTLPITVERKGNPVPLDARPAILAIDVDLVAPAAPADVTPIRPATVLRAELATQPRSLRPAELVRALDPSWAEGRVLRTHQWTLVDGARLEPIPLVEGGARSATSTAHANERAS